MAEVAFMRMGVPMWIKQGEKLSSIFRWRDSVTFGNAAAGSWVDAYGSDEKPIAISGAFKKAIAIFYADSEGSDPRTGVILSEFDVPAHGDVLSLAGVIPQFRLHNDGTKVSLQYLQNIYQYSARVSVTIIAK